MNLYLESSLLIQLDRILLFITSQEISDKLNATLNQPSITRPDNPSQIKHNSCDDDDVKQLKPRCDPKVRYFGWKVTAIILIIVTIGSLILVISLSVTMPYNVWDKPKIQMLPARADGVIT